jgi:DNA-directed RNA polymerase specialized sigma24 family protein
VEAAAEVFEGWIGTIEPLQAWIASSAWIPAFNTYEDFMQTVYESAVAPDWHRADQSPRMTWLRFVAARLWLDESFVEALDSRQLETVAELSRYGRVTALSLRPGRSLAELEAALTPILPRFRGGQLRRE